MDASSLSSLAARLRRWMESLPNEVSKQAFEALALELFSMQSELNPAYSRFCKARGGSISAWKEIPAVPAAAFKELELTPIPQNDRTTVFHSSGTTGQQPSRHFHSEESLAVYETSVLSWFRQCANVQPAICNFYFLTPPPEQVPNSSLVHMFATIRRKLGKQGSRFLGQADETGWTLNFDATTSALKEAAERTEPLFLMGTAFSFVHLSDYLAEKKIRFQFPEGSAALETGGYKGRSRTLSKASLRTLIRNHFGIPEMRIISEYGMSELSSQAYDKFLDFTPLPRHSNASGAPAVSQFPPWARAMVISPETGREVEEGKTGLLRILDLANVFSVMAIQTEDLAIRRGGGFELLGRAALAETRGCSLMTV